ncbi:unnamed protein product [Closterium sp. Naga37s-1]|nr:unnamed protein product [Closterium sp. Naga37s-1]
MSSLDGLLLCIAVHLLYGFYLESFNRTVAIGALQWIAMQGATQARDDEAAAEERRRIERLQRQRKERRARRMAEWVTELRIMEDDDFVNVFRISPELLEFIAPVMALPMSHFIVKLGIPLDLCVLIPIKYFASAMTFIDLGLYFGLPKTIVHRIVEAFLVHFPRRFKKTWVRFPTAEEMAEMASDFKEGIFQQSELHARLERGDLGPYQIVGDAAYPLRSYCLTPVNATRRRLMKSWEQTYNYIHSATRMVVERTIVRPAQAEEAVWEAHASCLPEEAPPVAL